MSPEYQKFWALIREETVDAAKQWITREVRSLDIKADKIEHRIEDIERFHESTMRYRGRYNSGKIYSRGDVIKTHAGSAFFCLKKSLGRDPSVSDFWHEVI